MSFLGIDGGGSATRWALCDAGGAPLAAGEVAAASGHLFVPAERARFAATAAALRLAVGDAVAGVVAGITGLAASAPEAVTAAGILGEHLGIPADAVQVHDDMWIAYHAAFAPGAGHVVYAGTGSVGIHVRADGTAVRVGGRGMLIDDAGSAFWIGQQALMQVWRECDVDPRARSPLGDALAAAIGASGWDAARAHVYGGGRAAVAGLARAVAATDDPAAVAILRAAGAALARLAAALVQREGRRPVALLGRAATLHPVILAGMRAAAPSLSIATAQPDAALAAARLAASAAPGQAAGETRRT